MSICAAYAQEIVLWPEGAPGARGTKPEDKPSITAYLPGNTAANGAAVIICPGGGYSRLSMTKEGSDPAQYLARLGVTAFVLKYRHDKYGHPYPLADGQRAVRLVRSLAPRFGLDIRHVGIMGFSAGGHVAATAGTLFHAPRYQASDSVDLFSCRPDFMILNYPVIDMGTYAHKGSKSKLIGLDAPAELVDSLSCQKQVTPDTPPTYLIHGTSDGTVNIRNSELFQEACAAQGVPCYLYRVEGESHGIGFVDPSRSACLDWLNAGDLLTGGTRIQIARPFTPERITAGVNVIVPVYRGDPRVRRLIVKSGPDAYSAAGRLFSFPAGRNGNW